MNVVTVDIESPFIPLAGSLAIDKIFCIGVKSDDNPTKMFTYVYNRMSDGPLIAALTLINQHQVCVGHNLAKFDEPIIRKLVGQITIPLADTLIDSKLMYSKDMLFDIDRGIQDMPPKLWGSYSLKAFGYRLGNNKLDFEDFGSFSEEMLIYGKQDVDVTYQLYMHLSSQPNYPSNEVRQLEYTVADIINEQENLGFYFDKVKARELALSLKFRKMQIEHKLQSQFKPKFLPEGKPIQPKSSRKVKKYTLNPSYTFKSKVPLRHIRQWSTYKNGRIKLPAKTKFKFFTEPHKLHYEYVEGEYQKIKLKKFEPGSRDQIRKWLKADLGFEFNTYTAKGTPKVEAEALEGMEHLAGKSMREYLKIVKDLSQLETGKGSLLNNCRDDNTVTSNIDTNGTITGRFTSSNVNLNQIPAQKEFRELFTAPQYMLVPDHLATQLERYI